MERSMVLCGLVALCAFLLAVPAAQAEWVPDGVLIATSSIPGEDHFLHFDFAFIPDGEGGAFIAWQERRPDNDDDIFAQRIDPRGNLMWTLEGVAVCTASGYQGCPRPVSDGAGGMIVMWNDNRGGVCDIYGQRLDADGNPLWTPDGRAIRASETYQTIAGIVSNASGGAIVIWYEHTDRSGDWSLYAQMVDMNGAVLWGTSGIALQGTKNAQVQAFIPDGTGGAIVAWGNLQGAYIWLQKIDSEGSERWASGGIRIDSGRQLGLMADGSGGAILVWDQTNGNIIYGQRISSAGYKLWNEGGVPICTAPGYHWVPRLIPDGSGGAIVSWTTNHIDPFDWDIYAQRVDMNGNALWTENGAGVCIAPNQQQLPGIVPDGAGGGIFAWNDYYGDWLQDGDIYAQRISGEGTALWAPRGVPVCAAASGQAYPRCAPDGAGGAIVAWQDSRSGTKAIYVQRIGRDGGWGYPAPSIEAVRDVPGDQGGFVNLSWLASRLDPWPGHAISSYSIWRGISPEQATQALKSGGALLSNAADFGAGSEKPLVRIEKTGGAMLSNIADFVPEAAKTLVRIERVANRTFFWKLISTVSASHLDGYSEIVPTLFDSTAVCGEYHYFQVIAHGDDPAMYWISAPDSGRSIDNLPPAPPAGLAGTPGSDAAGLNLTWNRCCEADLGHYAVYRGATEGFEPGPRNRMAALADTMYLDGEWRAGSRYYYKVAAVDIHGNASGCSLLRPEDIMGGEERETPAVTYLAQNFPNPFNPSTKIVFGLKEPEFVSLRIYDAAGRIVRVLVEADRAAGVHEALWDGRDDRGAQMSSGLYFCRLKAGSFKSLRKMVLLK